VPDADGDPAQRPPAIEVQFAAAQAVTPAPAKIRRWARSALADIPRHTELVIRIVGEAESADLNGRYRGGSGPTDVLSFPYEEMPGVESDLLGDIVICAPLVLREAREQGKTPDSHWAHMVVHGILHLLGYDHLDESQACIMEEQERRILARMGYGDPYD
jgi:probable rRNA maturation factor